MSRDTFRAGIVQGAWNRALKKRTGEGRLLVKARSSYTRPGRIDAAPLSDPCTYTSVTVTALEKGAARRRHSLDIWNERSLTKETLELETAVYTRILN
jgi:hypothetical protein